MKVAICTAAFPKDPRCPAGGLEAAVSCQVEALLHYAEGIQLHVLVCRSARDEILPELPGRPYQVEFIGGGGAFADMLPASAARSRVQRRLDAIKPDVVHVQGAPQFVDGARYPSLLTIHGVSERDTVYRHRLGGALRGWLIRRLLRVHRLKYRHVNALTGYARCQLASEFRGRFHFVPNPVSECFFEMPRARTEPSALFVGVLTKLKNPHTLVGAMGRLKRDGIAGRLRVAGSLSDKNYVSTLQQVILEEGVTDRVDLLGSLPREGLLQEIGTARCMVHPSFQENSPMAIAEASAAGLPAVASAVGGIPEMVAHRTSGWLVDPNSAASIADGLRALFQDRVQADELGARARQRARVHHPRQVASELQTIYAEIVRETSHHQPR